MKYRRGRTSGGRTCLILMLIVTVTIGQDQPTALPTTSEAFPYPWNTLIGMPLAPGGYTEFINGSMARRLSKPLFFEKEGLGQSIRVGLWATTYFPLDSSGMTDIYHRDLYFIGFVMLDFDYALITDLSTDLPARVSLVGGLGAGPSNVGLGVLGSAGLRLEIARLMGELRLNVNNGVPSPSVTLNVGYQSKTAVGASLLSVAALVALLISVALLASALSLF